MTQANVYYQHSGQFSLAGLFYIAVFGTIGTIVLGAVYGYILSHIPFIYLNLFITLSFGSGIGFLVGLGGKIGHVRSASILLIGGFIFGLLATYIGWVAWIFASTKEGVLSLRPAAVWGFIRLVSENGMWGIGDWTPTGRTLYIIWSAEALIIVATSTLIAWLTLQGTFYCEFCQQWLVNKYISPPLDFILSADELPAELSRGDYSTLTGLSKSSEAANAYTEIILLHCSNCQHSYYLTLKSIIISKDSNGREEVDEDFIVEGLAISADRYQVLRSRWQ